MVWLKFVICILVIFFAGQRVAKYGDIISERTGIGQVWMGVIAIALVTSLPELFTGISAVTLVGAPDLAVGDLVGANAFNLFNLALLDIFHRNGSIMAVASRAHRLTGWFSLALAAIVGIFIFVSAHFSTVSLGWIGWYTPIILFVYIFAVRRIFVYEKEHKVLEEPGTYPVEMSLKRIYTYFCIAAVFIIGAGIWLAIIGEEISRATGWGESFVGSLFLAFTTTLPEITVSFTAMRIGAVDMAIANMIGSNLFNLAIIPVIDLIYTKAPVLAPVSESHIFTAGAVVVMSLIFIGGLCFKPSRHFRLSWLNLSLIILFLVSAYLSFIMA